MTAKKTYFYDYKNTIPVVNEDASPAPKPVQTPQVQAPQTEVPKSKGPTFNPPPVRQQAPMQRPNVLPTILIVVLVVAIGYLAYSLLPQNYASCSSFPGSRLTSEYPGGCTTFYGKSFTQSNAMADIEVSGDVNMTESDNSFPLPEFPSPTPRLAEAESEGGPTPANSETTTTKGGLPIETSNQTETTIQPTPTPKPATTTGSDSGATGHPDDWIKHKYPTQHIALYLPPRFTSTSVTRNIDTSIQTFTLYDGNASVVQATIYPNWAGFTDIRDRSVTFMITDNTGVIKASQDNTHTYYFEKNSLVYTFACSIDSSTCDQILKSLSFI